MKEDRIFPISYETARMMVAKAGKMVGLPFRPHDLRRRSHRNCQQGDPQTLKPLDHSALPWKDHRHRSNEVD
jgi:hypothetical protein